jgi:hypothetical protein
MWDYGTTYNIGGGVPWDYEYHWWGGPKYKPPCRNWWCMCFVRYGSRAALGRSCFGVQNRILQHIDGVCTCTGPGRPSALSLQALVPGVCTCRCLHMHPDAGRPALAALRPCLCKHCQMPFPEVPCDSQHSSPLSLPVT